jgi:hypothetical protein
MKRILVVTAVASLCATSASAQSIDWHVVDRFRLWDRARVGPHVISLEQLLGGLAAAGTPAEIEALMLRFLATQSDLYEKSYWRRDLETYDREYIWPTHYRVRLTSSGLSGTCTWRSTAGVVDPVIAPCDESTELKIEASQEGHGSLSARVTVSNGSLNSETVVQVRDRLIASVGDSFASGEGNPDAPMDLTRLPREFAALNEHNEKSVSDSRWTAYRFVPWDTADWHDRWLGRGAVVAFAGGADWWDTRCHRSFYSQHMVAALRYAAAKPREATTFVTYACSGAETFAGLLARQSQPPGYRDGPALGRLRYPQVEVLVANLCPPAAKVSAIHERSRQYPVGATWVSDHSWTCSDGKKPRPIDALLVSNGGNDIGFGPVIQDALLPTLEEQTPLGRAVLKRLRKRGAMPPEEANRRIRELLPIHFGHLRGRVSEILPPGAPVIQSAYPNPLYGSDSEYCAGQEFSGALAAIGGFWPDRSVEPGRRWEMLITEDEAAVAEASVINPLNNAIRQHVEDGAAAGWRLVDGFLADFEDRGWCARGSGELPTELPNWDATRGVWNSWSPSEWQPYAQRARLFRTPNDAAMTQQPANPRRLLGAASRAFEGSLSEQQESLLSAMAGSFHPTFEAHAIMGWYVGDALIAELDVNSH